VADAMSKTSWLVTQPTSSGTSDGNSTVGTAAAISARLAWM